MPAKSAFYAILNHKCPRCRKGNIFVFSILDKPSSFIRTHKTCPCCGLLYEREPGFFFGAMYVSYALTMAVMLGVAIVLYNFLGDPAVWVYVASVSMAVLLLMPVIFRFSRTLYLHAFGGISYDKNYSETC